VLVNKLGLPVSTKKNREIVEPGHNPLKFNAFDEEHRHRSFAFTEAVQENILKIIELFCHVLLLLLADRCPHCVLM
jgi:hypothetical protein